MKKILLGGFISAISAVTFANQPLVIQQGTPAPLYNNERTAYEAQYIQPKAINAANLNYSVLFEYTSQEGKFANDIKEDLTGFGVGFSTTPYQNGLWAKVEYQKNSEYDADLYGFLGGGHLNLINANRFYMLGTLGLGFSVLSALDFDDSFYITIPVELEAGYKIIPQLSVYSGIGYKWSYNVTDEGKTRCNDGTWSDSTGSGTCSWHDGIDYDYQSNYIGDYDGVTYKIGLRYNF